MLDVAVIGAGPAGIAAGRILSAAGRSVILFEARSRIGGRTSTVSLAGHAVDLGAHWLHAGPINPVVHLARQAGWRLKPAPQVRHLFLDGRRATIDEDAAYERAFGRADAALSSRRLSSDRASAALPALGRWRGPVAAITGLVAGRALPEISLADFASAEYAHNLFAPEGFGALVGRLAHGLEIVTATPVTEVDWHGRHIRLTMAQGEVEARAVIITVPPMVLQGGAVRLRPSLPRPWQDAIDAFRPAIYEHVLLRWPGSPFAGADRIATLAGRRLPGLGLLTCLDGSTLHYLELDQPMIEGLGRGEAAMLARSMLAGQFGHRAIDRLRVVHVTRWRADPWSLSSWSIVPPGAAHIRSALTAPLQGKLFFAGEATDKAQWGTVGGAWVQGERAAREVLAAIG